MATLDFTDINRPGFGRMRPMSNITPFTYQDGATYLEMLSKITSWVNDGLIEELNSSLNENAVSVDVALAEKFQEHAEFLSEQRTTVNETLTRLSGVVETIRNKVGPPHVQKIRLTEDTVFTVDSEHPTTYPIDYIVTQDNVGNRKFKTGANIVGNIIIDERPNKSTAFRVTPNSAGEWVITGGMSDTIYAQRDFDIPVDGSDATARIQEAVDYLVARGGGTLFFEPGTYTIHGNVLLRKEAKDITITGTQAAVLRKTIGSTNYCVFAALSGNRLGYLGGAKNITISDLTFRGDLGKGVSVAIICAHRLSGLRVHNVRTIESSQNGHLIDLMGCENVRISHSEFGGIKPIVGRGYTEAIQIDSSVRVGLGFDETHAENELWDGTPTRNVLVEHCKFVPSIVDGVTYQAQSPIGSHTFVDGRYYDNIEFSNNEITGVVANDGSYAGIIHFTAANNVRILNNRIDGKGVNNQVVRFYRAGNAIPIGDVSKTDAQNVLGSTPGISRNITIEGNRISNIGGTDGNMIWVYGVAEAYTTDVVIRGNVFKNCKAGATAGYAIQTTFIDDLLIEGNRFSGSDNYGTIYGHNHRKLKVLGNIGYGGRWYPISVGSQDGPIVEGNIFIGYVMPIDFNKVSNITCRGNRVTVLGDRAAILVHTAPENPGYVNMISNIVQSLNATPVQISSDAGVGISSEYPRGVVALNQAKNYAVAADVATGITGVGNVEV